MMTSWMLLGVSVYDVDVVGDSLRNSFAVNNATKPPAIAPIRCPSQDTPRCIGRTPCNRVEAYSKPTTIAMTIDCSRRSKKPANMWNAMRPNTSPLAPMCNAVRPNSQSPSPLSTTIKATIALLLAREPASSSNVTASGIIETAVSCSRSISVLLVSSSYGVNA